MVLLTQDASSGSNLATLSKEWLVAREIYAASLEGHDPVYFNKLVDRLTARKLASRATVSRALDILFDQAVVRADWVRAPNGQHVRALKIAGEAREFVQSIYESTKT